MGLIVCCDGGEVTASYLVKNNIRPDRFVFTYLDIQKSLTYLNADTDKLLIIVSGFTEWSIVTIQNIVSLLKKYEIANNKALQYEIMSNIPLEVECDYVFFEGDLISGKETIVTYNSGTYKKTPLKPTDKKAITKYVGTNAKRVKFEPIKRMFLDNGYNPLEPERLRRNVFEQD